MNNLEKITRPAAPPALSDPARIGALIDAFLSARDVSQNSKFTYRRTLKIFFDWIDQNPPGPFNMETILKYKADLTAQGYTAASVSNCISAVRCFFTWAESMKYFPNIAKGVKGAKTGRDHRRDGFAVEQAKEILAAIDRTTPQGKRDFALINLKFHTALRDIEVSRANIEDMGTKDGAQILRIRGKGRDEKDAFVILTPSALGPIREYLKTRKAKDSDPLFVSHGPRNGGGRLTTLAISRMVKERARRVGIISRRLTSHSCRHSAITFALMAGATIQEAQALGRHANINTTLIYSHNLDRIAAAPEKKIDTLLNG